MCNKNFVLDKKVPRLFIVVIIMITQCIILSHDVVRHLRCRSRRFYCLLLVFITRWGRLITLHHLYHDGQEWCISILIVPGRYSQCGPLYGSPYPRSCSLRRSAAVLISCYELLNREYPRFRNVYSIIPVDVIRVKSDVNSFFDPTGVPVRVSIIKLYLVPKLVH